MKLNTMSYVATITVLLTVTAYAQAPIAEPGERAYFSDILTIQQADFAKIEKKYAVCFSSANDGVVESALAHAAMFKLMYPVKELAVLKRAVENVAATNSSPEVRYKAYLVQSLYANPKQFVSKARTDYASPDELFGALASAMYDVIVSNMTK